MSFANLSAVLPFLGLLVAFRRAELALQGYRDLRLELENSLLLHELEFNGSLIPSEGVAGDGWHMSLMTEEAISPLLRHYSVTHICRKLTFLQGMYVFFHMLWKLGKKEEKKDGG